MSAAIDRAAVEAFCNRAKQLVLTSAYLGNAENLLFAQGCLNALKSVLSPTSSHMLARRDASLGGYQALAGFEGAWAALPVDAERLSLGQVQEFLRSHGVQVATDSVTDTQFNAVAKLHCGKCTVVNGNNEHGAARTELDDGAGLHGAPSGVVESDIVREVSA